MSPALAHPLTLYARADHFVLCSVVIHGLTNSDARIYEMYDQFGPIPRICFNFLSDEALLIRHKGRNREALQNLSFEKLGDIFSQRQKLSIDAESHAFLLETGPRSPGRISSVRSEPGRQRWQEILLRKLGAHPHAVKLELWNQL
jgi:hypothetical protein